MEVQVRKIGKSQAIVIPEPILALIGLGETADLQVHGGVIEIRAVRRNPREGWAEDARRIAELGDDALLWDECGNEDEAEIEW